MQPIISVKNLSKRYKLGVFNAKTLREEAEAFLARFSRGKEGTGGRGQGTGGSGLVTSNPPPATAEPSSDFWALRDVSFDVQPGEVIGVIGRNGAGKSTLLKILSRITEPTSGEARIRGRVASLLEVGTGFHPELTGRENVFLNGAILGMTKQEIRNKFDEIVAFAEIEKFIDTPVKRYSSGMYVRLAFAVAAHLEPEILIVDEVLAVGDVEFQRKCLGKMHEVSDKDGRTVLFVSHNMDAVSQLCSSAILLRQGRLEENGSTEDVLRIYLGQGASQSTYTAPADKRHGILQIATRTPVGQSADLSFDVKFACAEVLKRPTLGVVISSLKGVPLFGSNSLFHPWLKDPQFGETGAATVTFEDVPLWSGSYRASFWLSDANKPVDTVLEAVTFEVLSNHLPAKVPPTSIIGQVHVTGRWMPL